MGLKGLHVSILRNASHGDCTACGITSPSHGDTALLLGIEDGVYDEDDALRAFQRGTPVLVVERRTFGSGEVYVTAKPWGEKRHTMAGGNFVYSHDSRFRSGVCAYPISVHDRIE